VLQMEREVALRALDLRDLVLRAGAHVGPGGARVARPCLEHGFTRAGLERELELTAQGERGRLVHDVLALLIAENGVGELAALDDDVGQAARGRLSAGGET